MLLITGSIPLDRYLSNTVSVSESLQSDILVIHITQQVSLYLITFAVFCPHWSALLGNNHLSDELTTSQTN